jgi:type II secretory pathway pseudopilin PulG
MIVVAIVIVLATVAVISYRRYLDNARKSEVYSLFGEIRTKEEAYRAEFSSYLSLSTSETDYWPVPVTPSARVWQPGQPAAWGQLGLLPSKQALYGGYAVVAGAPSTAGAAGPAGLAWFGGAVPASPWWYAAATCDNDGDPAVNATFLTSSDNTAVLEQNIHN